METEHKLQQYQIRITGTVQGVFFRQSAKEKATELGISGYARNLPDGSVYIAAEGEPEALQQFLAWCQKGPEMARVARVESHTAELKGYEGFEIRHSA